MCVFLSLLLAIGIIFTLIRVLWVYKKKYKELCVIHDKVVIEEMMLNQWLIKRQCEKSISDFFVVHGYSRVIVYGMGVLGQRLCEELQNEGIAVVGAYDRRANSIISDFKVCLPREEYIEADCIIITSMYYYDEIKRDMERKTELPIHSIEDVVYYFQ